MSEQPGETRIRWYRTSIDKETLRELTRRSDWQGLKQSLMHLGLVIATGGFAYYSFHHLAWPWTLVALFLHGTCMSFTSPAAACHELCHGTPFKTRWLNELFLGIFAFLSWTNPVWFRTSHTRHHQYTLHKPYDLEVVLPQPRTRPMDWFRMVTFSPTWIYNAIRGHVRHATGILTGEWANRIFPESEPALRRRLVNWARFLLIGHLLLAVWFVAIREWILIPIVVLPFYSGWLATLCVAPQHKGMQSQVPDFRRCCRTVIQDPLTNFLYWQMNYHIEHHMYAGVPFFNLRKLHRLVQEDGGPQPPRGLIDTWREIFIIDRRQREEPGVAFDSFSRGSADGPRFVPQEATPVPAS